MPKYKPAAVAAAALTLLLLTACGNDRTLKTGVAGYDTMDGKELYQSETLSVIRLSENTWQHISYLNTEDWGKVTCNGMIVVDKGEAIIFDTPSEDEVSAELIEWVMNSLNLKIIAVIPTHYHADNLGGLNEFHKRGIASHAYIKTIEIANGRGYPQPQHGFDKHLELKVGDKKAWVDYFGGGHTVDNVVGYFPHDDIMFGGCLIKEVGSGKGNLEEADESEWAQTVMNVKAKYPAVKKIIPGHGESGGMELLDYTIKLFE